MKIVYFIDHLRHGRLQAWRRAELTRFTVKAALSLICLALVFSSFPLDEFIAALRTAELTPIFFAGVLFFPTQLLAASRWHLLLTQMGRPVSFQTILRSNIRGQVAALFLPSQLSGDAVRAIAIANGQQGKAVFVVSVLVDKASGLAALAILALAGTFASPHLGRFVEIQVLALGLLAASIALMLLPGRAGAIRAWTPASIVRRLDRTGVCAAASEPLPGTTRVSLPVAGVTLLGSICFNAANMLGSYLIARALHINIGPWDWAAVSAAVALAQLLPLTIGGLGIREGMFVRLLAGYGTSTAQAAMSSLVTFLIATIVITVFWLVLEGAQGITARRTGPSNYRSDVVRKAREILSSASDN